MRIKKLTSNLLIPVKGKAISAKNNSARYFNIRHGSASESLHYYSLYMDSRYFRPKDNENEIVLNDDDYVLKPVFKNGTHIKDRKGNSSYILSVDDVEDHKKDYIILWEIPNKFYTKVCYKISGNVNLLGEGALGRVRENTLYSSPAPVLEIYGNCTLEWSGSKDGNIYKQVIVFKDDEWEINKIIKEEHKDEQN